MALWSPRLGQKGSSFGNIPSPTHNRRQFSPQKVSRSWHSSGVDMESNGNLLDGTILASLESLENNNITSHLIYHYASQVFNGLSPGPKSDKISYEKDVEETKTIPVISVKDARIKRKIYDLAFETLKYQALLEDVLMDSGFYSYDASAGENHGMIMVILCDMVYRKFAKRARRQPETCIPYIQEVEEDMLRYTTKLNAALARNRIKYQAASIENLLPATVREREKCGSQLPCYAWINQLSISVQDAVEELQEEGFRLVSSIDRMVDSHSFVTDHHCSNVLMFHASAREEIQESELVRSSKLILQDKTCCLGPHSVKAMLNEGDDIIHTNVGNGWTTAHLATLTNQDNTTIYAFGVKDDEHLEMLESRMGRLRIHNIKFIRDDFLTVQPNDTKYKGVKVVMVTPKDSRSGIINPVEYILQEGEDPSILRELSQEGQDTDRIDELAQEHMDLMKHALKFYRVQAVVYATTSIMKEENENVVAKSAEFTNSKMSTKNNPYRPVPPVLPLTPHDLELQSSGKFLRMEPSNIMGGCFVAILSREDEAMSAADVLARAAAKGLCDLPDSKEEKKKRKGKGQAANKKSRQPKTLAQKVELPKEAKSGKQKPVRTAKSADGIKQPTKRSPKAKPRTRHDAWMHISSQHHRLMLSSPP
ncbi:putative methyltransferase NSUN7 [Lytechinus variegatus]|uniref:putative methyltransferase NSUN7 n=1 Tax=Lytechinus variegatus TaxID=7654 RepID=UPI001BB12683|nr:putative methyltransferase NSUN7 [Lytechinus variegatus]XP_041453655.1 putative methyltransferase NSUN7 [Lytechinus variegatus]